MSLMMVEKSILCEQTCLKPLTQLIILSSRTNLTILCFIYIDSSHLILLLPLYFCKAPFLFYWTLTHLRKLLLITNPWWPWPWPATSCLIAYFSRDSTLCIILILLRLQPSGVHWAYCAKLQIVQKLLGLHFILLVPFRPFSTGLPTRFWTNLSREHSRKT